MNYAEAVAYIESLSPTLVKPGLERFALFMEEHGKLQDQAACLHVAGTNGKGSVVAMLAETLKQAGLKTGRYTGPNLLLINERFQIDGRQISNAELASICSQLKDLSESFAKRHPEHGQLTWFEILTAIAFYYFDREKTAASVFEVGLGGRFDATNVLSAPSVTGIVTVSLDHTHLLGGTIAEIAFEKAGILKGSVPLVTACSGEALSTILAEAKAKDVPVICVDAQTRLSCGSNSKREKSYVEAIERRFAELAISPLESVAKQSGYQRLNAAVAAVMLAIWEIETGLRCLDRFDGALGSFFWPGRLQYFPAEHLLLDGAHNEAGARALKQSLDELFPSKSRCFLLCFYKSKHFTDIMKALLRPGDMVFASQTTGRRPIVPAREIVRVAGELSAEARAFDSLPEAFKAAQELEGEQIIRVATGSFAAVAAGLNFLGYQNPQDSQNVLQTCGSPPQRNTMLVPETGEGRSQETQNEA